MLSLNEKEIAELGKEKRVKFPAPKATKQSENNVMPSVLNAIAGILEGMRTSINAKFEAIESKIDAKFESIKTQQPSPKVEKKEKKKPDQWDFKIIRDMDNRILKIEATRR